MNNKTIIDFIPSKAYINEHLKDSLGRINLIKFEIIKQEKFNWCNSNLEYIYCIENDIFKQPICLTCNTNPSKFKSYAQGYKKYCSLHCTLTSKEVLDRKKETCLKTYGTEFSLQSNSVKEKSKKTNLEKYGVEHNSRNQNSILKRKQTNLKKYGAEHTFQSEQIKNKIKSTLLDKYGVDNVSKNSEIKKKKEKTFLTKFGETCNLKSQETKNKIKETNLKKYGVDISTQQNIDNYDNYTKAFIEEHFINDGVLDIEAYLTYFNISTSTGYKTLKRLNITYEKTLTNKYKTQEYIFNMLKDVCETNTKYLYKFKYNTYDIIKNKQNTKLELDIYIEIYENNNGEYGNLIKKIAIEYNGLMFHSFGISNHNIFNTLENESLLKYKHLEKTELCEEQSIHLFHIFENEWLDLKSRSIWISMLKNALMLNSNKIMARSCNIIDISDKKYNEEIRNFLEQNHIQGFCQSKIKLGLYYQNELVSLMTFGKCRYNKNVTYELLRFCSILNTNIIGGSSKLLHYFKEHYMNTNEILLSYGNRRWTNISNNIYLKNNFQLSNISEINYYYFHSKDCTKLYHRSHFQKHKLKMYFDNCSYNIKIFDNNKSERVNMYENGYRKIYELGQLVFKLIKS